MSSRSSFLALVFAPVFTPFLVLGCAGQSTPIVAPFAETPPARALPGGRPTLPGLRLPEVARPHRQAVKLRLIPTQEAFSGTTEIDLELRGATDVIWLHAAGLEITKAELETNLQTQTLSPSVADEFLGLVADRPVGPGRFKLRLAFNGQLPGRENSGAYRQEENGDWYVFTQFEATDARRAFPCFDEPSFKIPWQLTLEVRSSDLAFANTPQVSQSAQGEMKTLVFAESKPLPSYLVAYAVGPFEVVDAGKAGRKPTPIRIIVPRGKTPEAGYAVKTTGEVLTRLENYFDIPYPYEKLDHIAVPQKGGAMENPGLITFGTTTILGKPDQRNIRLERGYLGIAGHEIGHIWFGDLVTMAWWDDLWLNEAFASWIAPKMVDEWHPEWEGKTTRVLSRSGVMGTDALVSARRIRQPIHSKHDIENAFDGITYTKGAAIIAMFESFVGPDRFREGVRQYLRQHAHGNATGGDFLRDVGAVVGKPEVFATAFSTFLDQPGFPLVTAELNCDAGRPARLGLTQQRYLPLGSPGGAQQTWQVPVCARYPEGRSCTLLTGAQGELELAESKGCPSWVLANADGTGYYRVQYKGDLLERLLRDGGKSLSVAERLSLLGDVSALVRNGRMLFGDALALIPTLARDENRHILTTAAGLVESLSDHYVPDPLRPRYKRLVAGTFGARARRLGWEPKPDESDETRLLRPSLASMVAWEAEDEALRGQARRLAEKWLDDRKAIVPELVGDVLSAAAAGGDRALWEKFYAAARKEKDRRDRTQMLGAMGNFTDKRIVQENFKIVLSETFDPRESLSLIYGAASDRRTRQSAYEFVKQHNDEIVARLPREFGLQLAGIGGGFCDAEHRADLEAFFKERAERAPGGPRTLAQTLERMDLCIAMHKAHQASVTNFLKKQ
jgi:cytosol alanyl aminopeptidase